MTNQIFLKPAWSIFLGVVPENSTHSHYSLEICISLYDVLKIGGSDSEMEYGSCIIGNNIRHKHLSSSLQLSILFSPLSELAIYYAKQNKNRDFISFTDTLIEKVKVISDEYLKGNITNLSFIDKIQSQIEIKKKECSPYNITTDKRILASIKYLQDNYDKVVSLKEISSRYHLSTSRFLHLFKKEAGISFRKIQVWNRLAHSFKLFQKAMTLTEIAHECGFTDSAHFSKKFKETFGISPKQIRTATLYNFIA
jgi:AraC-like DNA-binding protein